MGKEEGGGRLWVGPGVYKWLIATGMVLGVAGVAVGTTSTDTQFLATVKLLTNWLEGTLGTVIRIAWLIVGMAIGIRTGKVVAPFAGVVIVFFPTVVSTVFGGLI